jgi:hypothetical protein
MVSVKFGMKVITLAALPTAKGSRGPRVLRQELCSLARTLGPWVRIPLEA